MWLYKLTALTFCCTSTDADILLFCLLSSCPPKEEKPRLHHAKTMCSLTQGLAFASVLRSKEKRLHKGPTK